MNDLSSLVRELCQQTQCSCPPECWLHRVAERPGILENIDEAIEVVDRSGEWTALLDRARKQHGEHSKEADDRVIDVLTEAIAFAYASCKFPAEQFVFTDDNGKHDIESANFAIEAKSLHPPVDRQEENFATGVVTSRANSGLMRKVRSQLDNAARQLANATQAKVVVVNILGTDELIGDALPELTIDAICREARVWLDSHPEISEVVVIWNFKWCEAKVVKHTA